MLKVCLIGRLGKDAESKFAASGKFFCNISIACDDGYGENKKTVWVRATLWETRAEKLAQYLTKGQQVYIEGPLRTNDKGEIEIWTGNDGTSHAQVEMAFVEKLELLGGPHADRPAENAYRAPASSAPPAQTYTSSADDVPF